MHPLFSHSPARIELRGRGGDGRNRDFSSPPHAVTNIPTSSAHSSNPNYGFRLFVLVRTPKAAWNREKSTLTGPNMHSAVTQNPAVPCSRLAALCGRLSGGRALLQLLGGEASAEDRLLAPVGLGEDGLVGLLYCSASSKVASSGHLMRTAPAFSSFVHFGLDDAVSVVPLAICTTYAGESG